MALFVIHSLFTHAAPYSNWISIGKVSTPQGILPDLPGWLLVTRVESAPDLIGYHDPLAILGLICSMEARHSNSSTALKVTMLCGNVTARHKWYKNDPLDFISKCS